MPDARISEDSIHLIARLVNEAEDMKRDANDALKAAWSDYRESLKALGLKGPEVSAEVGFLKAAIADKRMSDEDRTKAEMKAEGVEGYLEILNSPRARARARKEPQSAPQAAQSLPDIGSRSSPDRREGDDDGQPFQPETANDVGEAQKVERRSPKPEDAGSIPATYANAGSEALAVARGEAEPAAIYTFTPKPHDGPYSSNGLPRPKGCQHVDACAGTHSKRCYGCERAWTSNQPEPESAA